MIKIDRYGWGRGRGGGGGCGVALEESVAQMSDSWRRLPFGGILEVQIKITENEKKIVSSILRQGEWNFEARSISEPKMDLSKTSPLCIQYNNTLYCCCFVEKNGYSFLGNCSNFWISTKKSRNYCFSK